VALVLKRLNVHEKIKERKRRKKSKRQAIERVLAPLQPSISRNLSGPGAGQFQRRLGQITGRKTVIVNPATGQLLSDPRSLRGTTGRVSPLAVGRASVAPLENLVRILGEIKARRALRPNPQTLTPQTDLESLYEHLGIAQNRVVGQLSGTRQPVYDLIDFERQGRAVRLTKTSTGPNQGASFQFQVPEDFSLEVQGIEVSSLIGPGNTTMEVLAGWIGASESVKYAKINVQAGDAPKPIFGANVEKAGGEWTREEPIDLPQGGVLTINSGLDLNNGDILTITIQYELKPSFRQISKNPNDWIIT